MMGIVMSKSKIGLMICAVVMMAAGVGCVALSKYVTPADRSNKAVDYAVKTGVAEPNDYAGYFNLKKAEELVDDINAGHVLRQQELQQAIDRDNTEHNIAHGKAEANRVVAAQREEALFGEGGLLSMGLTLAGFGGFTGLLGLMRKRPGDLTREEMEKALADATGKTTEELNNKQRQFVQVVKGIQEYMQLASTKDDEILALKAVMDKYQDTSTKVAVATAKKENG